MFYDTPSTSFPQQVSVDQAGEDKSEIAFSNGVSYPSLNPVNVKHKRDRPLAINSLQRRHDSFGQSLRFPTAGGANQNAQRLTKPARHPDFSDRSDRLRSYARWTRRRPDSIRLSEAGFFYTDQHDLVRCFQCGIGLKDFSDEDDPLLEHIRHSPDCPYLVEYLGPDRLSAIKMTCRTEHSRYLNGHHEKLFENTKSKDQPRHPEYSSAQARLSSFAGWPRHLTQTPPQLAEAGLYYTGFEDQVRCFTCGGGLKHWDAEDNPWTEHCRWFPNCQFARNMKGDEFIALVQASTENLSGATGSSNEQNIPENKELATTMERMTLKDPELRAALQEHKDTCLEMGFKEEDIDDAEEELMKKGKVRPTLEEILDTLDSRKEKQEREGLLEKKENETPLEENQRLKGFLNCMTCRNNNVNALFLPCTHHRLCMECAEPLSKCPVCEKHVRQKIRTFLA